MMIRCAVLATAIAILPHAAEATPIWIQELAYDAPGPDAPHAFTELAGAPGTSLDSWSVVGVNGSSGTSYRIIDLTGGTIPTDGIFVIATSKARAELAAERDFIGAVDWQNGPDAIQLWSPFGVIIDALQYGDAGDHNAGEGEPADDVAPGMSLTRDPAGTDTNDNASDFRPLAPTPGRLSSTPLAEPPILGLFFLATPLLFRRRKKGAFSSSA